MKTGDIISAPNLAASLPGQRKVCHLSRPNSNSLSEVKSIHMIMRGTSITDAMGDHTTMRDLDDHTVCQLLFADQNKKDILLQLVHSRQNPEAGDHTRDGGQGDDPGPHSPAKEASVLLP